MPYTLKLRVLSDSSMQRHGLKIFGGATAKLVASRNKALHSTQRAASDGNGKSSFLPPFVRST